MRDKVEEGISPRACAVTAEGAARHLQSPQSATTLEAAATADKCESTQQHGFNGATCDYCQQHFWLQHGCSR